jgi:hypothetical protein
MPFIEDFGGIKQLGLITSPCGRTNFNPCGQDIGHLDIGETNINQSSS